MGIYLLLCSLLVSLCTAKEGAPPAPTVLKAKPNGPTSVTLIILPFEDEDKILAYEVDYSDRSRRHHKEFSPTDAITINDLMPMTSYRFRIKAKNAYGIGPMTSYSYTTGSLDVPSRIEIVSGPNERFAHEYILQWKKPGDGGLDIRSYFIQLRPVAYKNGKVVEVLGDWINVNVSASEVGKTNSYVIKGLKPGTTYSLYMTASNDLGKSDAATIIFTTAL